MLKPSVSVRFEKPTIDLEVAFKRNFVFTKLGKRILNEDSFSTEIKEMAQGGWIGIPCGAHHFWAAFTKNWKQWNPLLLENVIWNQVREPNYIDKSNHSFWIQSLANHQNENIHEQITGHHQFKICSDVGKKYELEFKKAKNYLQEIWTEATYAFESLVSHVVWIEGNDFWSSSTLNGHGLIFVSPKPHWKTCHYIETIIHETSHIELMLRTFVDPLLQNQKEFGDSPLRAEQRPLLGILHAAFVLCRTCESLARFCNVCPMSELDETKIMLNDFRKKRNEGIETLKQQAIFTDIGNALFENMKKISANSSPI